MVPQIKSCDHNRLIVNLRESAGIHAQIQCTPIHLSNDTYNTIHERIKCRSENIYVSMLQVLAIDNDGQ